jgi:hypothetical protein
MRFPAIQLACIVVVALSRTAAAVPSASEPPTDQQGTQQPASNPAQPAATTNSSTSDASHAAATAASTTQKSAPSTDSSATAAKAAATASKTEKVQLTPDERRLIAMGYKMVTRNGQNYFCHQEDVLGSRLTSKKTCGSVQDLKFVIQQNQDTVQDMQARHEPVMKPQ